MTQILEISDKNFKENIKMFQWTITNMLETNKQKSSQKMKLWKCQLLSPVWLFVTPPPLTVAHQAPLSM